MKPTNPVLTITGPARITYKNRVLHIKNNVNVDITRGTFDIESAEHGVADIRESSTLFEIKATPVGDLDIADILYPYANSRAGDLVHYNRLTSMIDTATGALVIPAHRFRIAHPVVIDSNGDVPAGLTANQLYYVGIPAPDRITLHATEAEARAGQNPVIPTSEGTDDLRIIEQEPMKIQSVNDGVTYTFHNVAITALPDFNAKATETAFGEATFTAYRKFGVEATDTASFYTRTIEAVEDDGFDYGNVITEAFELRWGEAKPWNKFTSDKGVTVSFNLELREVEDDASGITTHQIQDITVEATARPNGLNEKHIWEKQRVQGAGAGRGSRLSLNADFLDLVSEHFFLRLSGAVLTTTPAIFNRSEARVGEVVWRATRQFRNGSQLPLFTIGHQQLPTNTDHMKSNTIDLAAGEENKTVNFATPFPSAPTHVGVTIQTPEDGELVSATVRAESISLTGFTVQFAAPIPAAGYKLSYLAVR